MAIKDFFLTENGDLSINQEYDGEGGFTNFIDTKEQDELRNQIAMCRIVSVSHDWFYDNIGADLEQIIGEPVSTNTLRIGKELIFDSLVKDEFIESDELIIEDFLTSSNSIGYNVFIRQKYNTNMYMLFKVTLDLIKGVEVLLEGDVSAIIK